MGAGSAYKQMIVYLFTTFLRYKIMVPLEPVMLVSICHLINTWRTTPYVMTVW